MSYDPEWLKLEESLGSRPLLSGSPQDIIDQYNGLGAMLATLMPPPDPTVQTKDTKVGDVPIRIYTPEGAEGKKLPIGVYTHGGGFICGDLNSEDPICRAMAKFTPAIIVSVDYRLGPKYKMPAMLDDSWEVVKWTHENASSIGGDPLKLFTTGGSAGGGLALMTANKAAAAGLDIVKGIAAVMPLTLHPDFVPSEVKSTYTSYRVNGSGVPIIDKASMDTFYDAVLADARDSETFVGLSKHLAKFPPTYVCVAEFDPLRDDGIVIEKLLREEGVKTKIDKYDGFPHYFHIFPQISAGQKVVGNLIAGVHFILGA